MSAMVRVRDLKLSLRAFIATYRWRRVNPVPCAPRREPLGACRVAVVSTAGLAPPGDTPFDDSVRGGDWSWRRIPDTVDVQSLEEHHRSDAFDHAGIAADRNLGMPLDRLRELANAGEIGSVAAIHVSMMGSITAPGRLVRDTLPAVADALVADGVDVVLLVPV
jgi:D-proline reductase (dithiol) PrdB